MATIARNDWLTVMLCQWTDAQRARGLCDVLAGLLSVLDTPLDHLGCQTHFATHARLAVAPRPDCYCHGHVRDVLANLAADETVVSAEQTSPEVALVYATAARALALLLLAGDGRVRRVVATHNWLHTDVFRTVPPNLAAFVTHPTFRQLADDFAETCRAAASVFEHGGSRAGGHEEDEESSVDEALVWRDVHDATRRLVEAQAEFVQRCADLWVYGAAHAALPRPPDMWEDVPR